MAFHSTTRSDPLPRRTISWSIKHQHQHQLGQPLIERLDNTEVLGGEHSSGQSIGHTGCVNALAWSPSGQLLASGSDDRNIVLWKLGSSHAHPTADGSPSSRFSSSAPPRYGIGIGTTRRRIRTQSQQTPDTGDVLPNDDLDSDDSIVRKWQQRSFPALDLGMLGKIGTGHRANIFSVKWAPNASESRLLTCAGDSHVRVFDINYMSGSGQGADGELHRLADNTEYTFWPEHSGACVRLFRCHTGRAKRISTEVSPDVFLTCAEDGDVRQMDLRVAHVCRSRGNRGSCPPPLAHYPTMLYSISVSKTEPWLFAVAGESPLAYLHDRRMIPRLIRREWGITFNTDAEQDALTMCVRSFGIPTGGFESPWVQDDGRTAQVSDTPQPSGRRLLTGNRSSITACQISEHNGRDLLLSYSSGHVYRFDIYDQPGILHANLSQARYSSHVEHQPEAWDSPRCSDRPTRGHDHGTASERTSNESTVPVKDPHIMLEQTEDQSAIITEDDSQEGAAPRDEIDVELGNVFADNNEREEGNEQRHLGDDDDRDGDDDGDDDHDEDGDEGEDYADEDVLTIEDLMELVADDAESSSDTAPAPTAPTVYPRTAYKGHCNKETVKDVSFAGGADEFVISGSDDGNWFMWDKHTAEIKGIWHGDSSVVNVMAMHPILPVFAVSGIDDTIKIFAPISVTPFPPDHAQEELDESTEGGEEGRKRALKRKQDLLRSLKLCDRMEEKDEIVARNERQLEREIVSPAASILWRLHPRLLGMDADEDPEGRAEGDCIIM